MAHRASSLAHAVFFLVIFALVTSDGRAQTLHEQGWRTFPKMVQVLKDSYKGNYEHTVIKNDTFIFQKTVVIDELLVTNGGDVLIVADELFLNAPIDTRIRFRMGPDYWLSPIDAEVGQQYGLGQVENIQYHLGALKAFDSLYLWRETYDPKGKKFVYEVAPRPERRTKAPSIVAELPQLPSAQVPLASRTEYAHRYDSTRPSDGADAPDGDVIWENVRSGNIRIFASKIHLWAPRKIPLAKSPRI